MTIDKEKLKALADEAGKTPGWYQVGSFGLSEILGKADQAFIAESTPKTIMALLAEIDRLEVDNKSLRAKLADQVAILESVQTEFKRYGDRFPDGFDGRVFRWVDDAVAAHTLERKP